MIQQAPSWTYNLWRQNWKDTGRQNCTAQYYNSQDMEVTKKSTNRWGDKEELLHVEMKYYSAIKKEWNSAICNNMDGPSRYYA